MIFERNSQPLREGDDGTIYQIGARTAAWQPNGYGSQGCTVRVTNGTYPDATGSRKVELLTVDVTSAGFTPDQMCGPARALAEAAENAATLDVPLSLRITKELDDQLRRRAAAEQIPTSALVRRLLSKAVHERNAPVLTVEQVDQIARRVAQETASGR